MSTDTCSVQHGVVEAITDDEVIVNIVASSACASCNAKGACGAVDSSKKSIHVPKRRDIYQIGQRVSVMVKNTQGMLAVFLGYIMPLIVMMVVLFAVIPFYGEGIAGLSALLATVVYYIVLSLFKSKLSKKFTFEISKL